MLSRLVFCISLHLNPSKKVLKERSKLYSEWRDSLFLKLKDTERAPACWRASVRPGTTTRDRLLFPSSPRDYSNIVQSSKQDSENATGSQDILTMENLNTLITPPFRGQAELCRTWFMIESLTYNCRKKKYTSHGIALLEKHHLMTVIDGSGVSQSFLTWAEHVGDSGV